MVHMQIDVIGGSLSGLSTAISIKEKNPSIHVIVHEKYKTIGYNHEGRRCGEAHSVEREWAKWKPLRKSIFNDIDTIETIIGKKHHVTHRAPGMSCMLNRQEFICQLARSAKKFGVVIQTNDKVKTIHDLDGDYIIDASGCPSSVKRELDIPMGITGVTYQQTLEDSNAFVSDTVKIVFYGDFGYFWVFPRDPLKQEVNLGIGVMGNFDGNLRELLESFKEEQKITGHVNYVTGGLIPLGLQKPFMYENVLFVGDAGVGAFPLTGQGIYRALVSGDIAGTCIANGCPQKYPYRIAQNFVKWDVMGKAVIYLDEVLKHVGPNAVFLSYNAFIGLRGGIH